MALDSQPTQLCAVCAADIAGAIWGTFRLYIKNRSPFVCNARHRAHEASTANAAAHNHSNRGSPIVTCRSTFILLICNERLTLSRLRWLCAHALAGYLHVVSYEQAQIFHFYGLRDSYFPSCRQLLTSHAKVHLFLIYNIRDSITAPAASDAHSCVGSVHSITIRSTFIPHIMSKRLPYCPSCVGSAQLHESALAA